MEENKSLPDHVQAHFMNSDNSSDVIRSREVFLADDKNVDLKTELILVDELPLSNKILATHDFLESILPGISPYKRYLIQRMRLRISTDRKSRDEYVRVCSPNSFDDNLSKISNFKNIMESKS